MDPSDEQAQPYLLPQQDPAARPIIPLLYESPVPLQHQRVVATLVQSLNEMTGRSAETRPRMMTPEYTALIGRRPSDLIDLLGTGAITPSSASTRIMLRPTDPLQRLPSVPALIKTPIDIAIINLYRDDEIDNLHNLHAEPILKTLSDDWMWEKLVMRPEEYYAFDKEKQRYEEYQDWYASIFKGIKEGDIDDYKERRLRFITEAPTKGFPIDGMPEPTLPYSVQRAAEQKRKEPYWFFICTADYPARQNRILMQEKFGPDKCSFLDKIYRVETASEQATPAAKKQGLFDALKGCLGLGAKPTAPARTVNAKGAPAGRKYRINTAAIDEAAEYIYEMLFDNKPPMAENSARAGETPQTRKPRPDIAQRSTASGRFNFSFEG